MKTFNGFLSNKMKKGELCENSIGKYSIKDDLNKREVEGNSGNYYMGVVLDANKKVIQNGIEVRTKADYFAHLHTVGLSYILRNDSDSDGFDESE